MVLASALKEMNRKSWLRLSHDMVGASVVAAASEKGQL